ncbi:MAG: hypothetical protein RQ736_06865 [Thiogranum sp.]|nr:hypothetical protein [Thiogranum sp.]
MKPVFAIGVCIGVLTSAGAVQGAQFTRLGDLDGGAVSSSANAVSADGKVTVGASDSGLSTGSGQYQLTEPFRWTLPGGMKSLGSINGTAFTGYASGVSTDGSVIVGSDLSRIEEGDGIFDAFRWTAADGKQLLGPIPTLEQHTLQYVHDVSADGQIIVGRAEDPFGSFLESAKAFRWTEATGMQSLDPSSFAATAAYAISSDGQVIAGTRQEASLYFGAAIWTEKDGWKSLGLPQNGNSSATAASADGKVIAGSYTGSSSLKTAFRWTPQGGAVLLTNPASGEVSDATAVSADGSRVVGHLITANQGRQAFLWDQVNGVRRVAHILAAAGVDDLADWAWTSATDISPDGSIIVGQGLNPDGNLEGWIADLSTGSTSVLLDIKPGDAKNSIDPDSRGKLKSAILTSAGFDASTIDVAGVEFGPGAAEPDWYRLDDVDEDGDWDLTLRFETRAVSLACGDSAATMTGMTFDGMQIVGTDSINTVGCR